MTLDYPIFCGSKIIRVAQSWIRVVGGQLGSFDFPGFLLVHVRLFEAR